jgi:hypothetical protein
MTAGVDRLWTTATTLAFRPGQHIQFESIGENGAIAITSWAVYWRLWLQVSWAASLAKVVTQPAAEETAVFGPDVNGQADKNE